MKDRSFVASFFQCFNTVSWHLALKKPEPLIPNGSLPEQVEEENGGETGKLTWKNGGEMALFIARQFTVCFYSSDIKPLLQNKTRISCRWQTHVTRCITKNVLQTNKVDAQCDKLVTTLPMESR